MASDCVKILSGMIIHEYAQLLPSAAILPSPAYMLLPSVNKVTSLSRHDTRRSAALLLDGELVLTAFPQLMRLDGEIVVGIFPSLPYRWQKSLISK